MSMSGYLSTNMPGEWIEHERVRTLREVRTTDFT